MGNCRSGNAVSPRREVVLLLLGLDNSGKSTLLANLSGDSTEDLTPTIGFCCTSLDIAKFHVKMYDLGGGNRLRNIWKNYYSEAYGCVFVIDASAQNRFNEAKEELTGILSDEKMSSKPILIFANKQDSPEAVDVEHLLKELNLSETNSQISHVVKCVALKSASRNKPDPSIQKGLHWLLNQIGRLHGPLSERVSADVSQQGVMEAQERRERAERVRLIKEERERQKTLAGIADEVEEEENNLDGPGANPFKPIKQAIVETEAREKAIKAQNKEIQKRLRVLDVKSGTIDPSRIIEVSSVGGGDVSGGCERKVCDKEDLHYSSSSSGLSSSSESLTDVTLKSSGSDFHPPSPKQPSPLPPDGPSTAVAAPAQERTSKKRVKRQSTLLSRLKNRSKTAPLEGDTTESSSRLPDPLAPLLPPPSSVTPAVEQDSKSPDAMTDSAGGDQQAHSIPLASTHFSITHNTSQDLPKLPQVRQTLPPIQVTRQPLGLADNLLFTEEDIRNTPVVKLSQPPTVQLPVVELC